MNQFDSASAVENFVWQLRLADYPRGQNRSLINDLFNGVAPYSDEQAKENNLVINFNDLSAPRKGHDARAQLARAIDTPSNFFTVAVDRGPVHKRAQYGTIITKEINKRLKLSLPYYETRRSVFANLVLHGIGPCVWHDKQRWQPKAKGVEDILVPSNTTLDLDNLSMFAVFESYTPMQLIKLTRGPNVDPAWNMPLVNKVIAESEKQLLDFGIPYAEIYSPEKQSERIKQDSGWYAADSLSTIDAFSFYFWNDEDKEAGWNKRVILDSNYTYGGAGANWEMPSAKEIKELKTKYDTRGEFLYNPGKRKYASSISELIHFQFGDLSAVGPFRYHSVRGLGYLLYAVCHLQNRLKCKFFDSVFEQLMQYYRVKSLEDVERALKINLIDKGFIDESVQFIPPQERWQINQALAQMAMTETKGMIGEDAMIYSGNDRGYGDEKEKTATQVMAEVNASTALVGAALQQAYTYEGFKNQEICRRFTIKDSKDIDVLNFRTACLKQGVPADLLNDVNAWNITTDRVVGDGNKTQAMAIANQLMAWRPMFDPAPQREVLKLGVLSFTDDPALTDRLVPDDPNMVSNSKVNAERSVASLMMGVHLDVQTGENHIEVVETLLREMANQIRKIDTTGGMATPDQLMGFQNMAGYIGQHIQIIAQNKAEKGRVKEYSDDLGKLMNHVKMFAQRLAEQQKKAQQNGNGGLDPKDAAKIQATLITAKAKADNTRSSHAQRTAQRQTQFEMKTQQDAEKHAQDLAFKAQNDALELAKESQKHRMKSLKE